MSARTIDSSSATRIEAFLRRFGENRFIFWSPGFGSVLENEGEAGRGSSAPSEMSFELLGQKFDQAQPQRRRIFQGKVWRQTLTVIADGERAVLTRLA